MDNRSAGGGRKASGGFLAPQTGRSAKYRQTSRAAVESLETRVMLSAASLRALAQSNLISSPLGSQTSNPFRLAAGAVDLPATLLPPQFHLSEMGNAGRRTRAALVAATVSPLDVAMRYLESNARSLGLTAADVADPLVTDQYTDTDTGVTHIYLRQRINGIEVSGADVSVHVMRDGQILSMAGGFVPDMAGRIASAGAASRGLTRGTPLAGADQALAAAASRIGFPLLSAPVRRSSLRRIGRAHPIFSTPGASLDDVTGKLTYVWTGTSVRLAWELVVRTPDGQHWYNLAMDADDPTRIHWGNDWVEHAAATYTVYPPPIKNPMDGARQVISDPADPAYSPFGWHDTNGSAGAEYTDTRGNNAFAQEDADANNSGGYRPSGGADSSALAFNAPVDLTQSPATYRDAAITNLFYWTNLLHDVHAEYGFTELAGNFQMTNYTGNGLGNDAVQADAQDGSGSNNANMATPADGSAPRLQMYLWNKTSPSRDGDFDNMIIAHEYGHGVSNRLTGGPANANALSALQSAAMGEGWSDWWGLMFALRPTDLKSGSYPVGTYVNNNSTGIRRYPYAYDMAVDPLTYKAFKTSSEPHDAGEIWASTLLDMTWLLIDRYGFDTDWQHGFDPANAARDGGNNLALKLVMDGLKIQPANPSMLAARDAILAADQALTGGANKGLIWTAFARRGMGATASDGGSASSSNVVEAFDIPAAYLKPRASGVTPPAAQITPITQIGVTFTKPMDPSTFSVASDVVSFTSPTGANLLGQIASTSWLSANTTLQFNFASPLAEDGVYTLVLGPDIRSADDGTAMDQDVDGIAGEPIDDRYSAKFVFDAVQLAVTATNPTNGSMLTVPITAITLDFNEAVAASTIGSDDLTLSRGTVTGATAVDADTVRYTIAGVTGDGDLTYTLAAGALTDVNGRPGAIYNGSYIVEGGTLPYPSVFSPQSPTGGRIYYAQYTTTLGFAGDVDGFTISLDAGQLLGVGVDPSATVQGRLEILGPNGESIGVATAAQAGAGLALNTVINIAGTYTIAVTGLGGTIGTAKLDVRLNSAYETEGRGGPSNNTTAGAQNLDGLFVTLAPGVEQAGVTGQAASSSEAEIFSFSGVAGQTVTLATNLTSVGVSLLDSSGTEIGRSSTGPTNVGQALSNIVLPATGTYYAKLTGTTSVYTLYVGRNLSIESEANATVATATRLDSALVAGNRSVAGNLSASTDKDLFSIPVLAGQAIHLFTMTPGDGPNTPTNFLDGRIRILDAAGTLLASDDNSALDGRNADLSYSPAADGLLYVEVSTVSASSASNTGNYILTVSGSAATGFAPMTVAAITPTDAKRVAAAPTTATVDFTDRLLLTSVQASDLTLDGVPATAVTIVDTDTLTFTLPTGVAPGNHTLAIAAGAVTDVHGAGVAAFSSSFFLDTTGPRVIATTLQQNAVIPTGAYSIAITFDEPMLTTADKYDADMTIVLGSSASYLDANTLTWDATSTVVTIGFSSLTAGRGTLTLDSGSYAFADAAGNTLDGETNATTWPIPGGRSGNGIAGGNFVTRCDIDAAAATALPATVSLGMPGSLAFQSSTSAVIQSAVDTDYFTITLDAGQTLSAFADPDALLRPRIEIIDPNGTSLGVNTALVAGADALLQNLPATVAGTYTLAVSGANSTIGTAKIQVLLNSQLEAEAHDGAFNDTPATAEQLVPSVLPLDSMGALAGATWASVYGVTENSASDYYALGLKAGDWLTLTLSNGYSAFSLFDPSGNLIANSVTASYSGNYDSIIRDMPIPADGQYTVRVNYQYPGTVYLLAALINADADAEKNGTVATANPVLTPAAGGRQVVAGAIESSSDVDIYRVFAPAGTPVTLTSFTPGDGANQPANIFNPILKVLDAAGAVLAQNDNSAPDGRNALLTYTPAADQVFYISIAQSGGGSTNVGNYFIAIDGATPSPPAFTATPTVADGARVASLSSLVINLSDTVDARTATPADFLIDGLPSGTIALASSGQSFTVNPAASLAPGLHTLSIAAGAFADLRGLGVDPLSIAFTIDNVAPRVIGSSVQSGDRIPAGTLAYTVTFDEPMAATTSSAYSLVGNVLGTSYAAASAVWNTDKTALTLSYSSLLEDRYTLTLSPTTTTFRDLAGNALDGETPPGAWPIPTGRSGNGAAGGVFTFAFDMTTAAPSALPTPTPAIAPRGDGPVFETSGAGAISFGDDTDQFTIDLAAGQVVSVLLTPVQAAATLAGSVTIAGPAMNILASGTGSVGQAIAVQPISIAAAGRYTITVAGAAGSIGRYNLKLTLNAMREGEDVGAPIDDTPGAAQALDSAFVDIAAGVRQATVIGALDVIDGPLPAEVEPNNSVSAANSALTNFKPNSSTKYIVTASGSIGSNYEYDYYYLGQFDVGDVVRVSVAAAGSQRGTWSDPYVALMLGSSTYTSDDNSGPGSDALIPGWSVTTAGGYYVRVYNYSAYTSGTYELTVTVDNIGAAPITGGNIIGETEPNDNTSIATDLSASWRTFNYISTTAGSASAADPDVFAYYFNAGDRVYFNDPAVQLKGTLPLRLKLTNAAGQLVEWDDGTDLSGAASLFGTRIDTTGLYYLTLDTANVAYAYALSAMVASDFAPLRAGTGLDYYSMDLAAGETVSLALDAGTLTAPAFSLLSPDGKALVSASAATGKTSIRNVLITQAGRYLVRVTSGLPSPYALSVTRGADVDVEPNNSAARAEVISANGKVSGSMQPVLPGPVVQEGFESGVLGPAWSTYIAAPTYGRVAVGSAYGAATGTMALMTDNNYYTYPSTVKEAILTVDLRSAVGAKLTFNQYSRYDSIESLPTTPYTGHANADGVSYSADGTTWYPLWTPSANTSGAWLPVSVDLGAAAAAAGVPISSIARIKFQAYSYDTGYYGARAWDDVTIMADIPGDDYYAVDLAAGDRVTLTTATPAFAGGSSSIPAADPRLELLGPAGGVLASDDNSAGDGRNARLAWTAAVAGRYFVRASTAAAGSYVLDVATKSTIRPAPDRPALRPGFDTGASASDSITRLNNASAASALQLTIGAATPGALVSLFSDGLLIGTAAAGSDGVATVTTDGAAWLDDGVHLFTARQAMGDGSASQESLPLYVTIATAAPLPPAVPALAAGSDSAVVGDNITSDSTPTLQIAPGSTPYYRVYRDGALVSGDYESAGAFTLLPIADGTHAIVVTAVDAAGNESAAPPPLMLLIDTTAPSIPVSAPDLRPTSDTGASDTDDITADNTPTFRVPYAGLGVGGYRVYMDGLLISSTFETLSLFTAPTTLDGVHNFSFAAADLAGNVSMAGPDLAVTIDTAAPAPPAAPDLRASSDKGASNADNLTSDNAPVFDASAGNAPYVRLFRDGILIGPQYPAAGAHDPDGLGGVIQPDGTATYTMAAVDLAGNQSEFGPGLVVTVDRTLPVAGAGSFAFVSGPRKIVVTFGDDVSASLGVDDLVLSNMDTGAVLAPIDVTYDRAANAAAFVLPDVLPNGNYRAVLIGTGVCDSAGNMLDVGGVAGGNVTVEFYHLAGDADRSRDVGLNDLLILANHYGLSGVTWADGDFDGDGSVGLNDLLRLANNYGISLPAPGSAVPDAPLPDAASPDSAAPAAPTAVSTVPQDAFTPVVRPAAAPVSSDRAAPLPPLPVPAAVVLSPRQSAPAERPVAVKKPPAARAVGPTGSHPALFADKSPAVSRVATPSTDNSTIPHRAGSHAASTPVPSALNQPVFHTRKRIVSSVWDG